MRKVLILFGALDDGDVEWLAAAGRRRRVPAGTPLLHEGERDDEVFIVLDGTFEVLVARLGQAPVATIRAGEVLGEMSFVDSRPASATVRATTDATVLAVPTWAIRDRLADDVAFAARFYRALAMVLSEKLRSGTLVGGSAAGAPPEDDDPTELSPDILNAVHLGGRRFEQLLRKAG